MSVQCRRVVVVLFLMVCAAGPFVPSASAQGLGTFRWQLHPYCNIVTLNVVQQGGVYTLTGVDEQCGAGQRASASGTAFPNPDGSIGIGLTMVSAPGGVPVHIDARITLGTLSGPWRDSAGHSGTFVFTPGPGVPGPLRPVGSNGVAPASITLAQLTPGALAAIPPPSVFSFGADGGLRAGLPEPQAGRIIQLQWLPNTGAFRAGLFRSNASVGQFSWAGGHEAVASANASFAFGSFVQASGDLSVAFGLTTQASGFNSVAMGYQAYACGTNSIALGARASTSLLAECGGTRFDNAFVFSDDSGWTGPVANRQFVVRASGGVSFWSSATTAGCHLNAGAGAWSCSSDRALKERFEPLDGEEVLRKVAAIPVETWSFKTESGVRHAGPVAQDFRAAFGLGVDDTTIGYTDINGINMRAIQALEARTRDLQEAVGQRDQRIGALEARLAELERTIQGIAGARVHR